MDQHKVVPDWEEGRTLYMVLISNTCIEATESVNISFACWVCVSVSTEQKFYLLFPDWMQRFESLRQPANEQIPKLIFHLVLLLTLKSSNALSFP